MLKFKNIKTNKQDENDEKDDYLSTPSIMSLILIDTFIHYVNKKAITEATDLSTVIYNEIMTKDNVINPSSD
jgi:hypothetical protein